MKKICKSIIGMLICASMMLALCGCETAAQKEAAVRQTAEGYLNALCVLDLETSATYTLKGEALFADGAPRNEAEIRAQLMQQFSVGMGDDFAQYTEKFTPMVDLFLERVKNSISYEIASVAAEEDKYIVSGKITYLDIDKVVDSFTNTDEAAMNDIVSSIVNSLIQSGKITVNTTDAEMIELVLEPLVPEITKLLESEIDKIGTIEQDIRLVVEKADEKWLINDTESDVNIFGEAAE